MHIELRLLFFLLVEQVLLSFISQKEHHGPPDFDHKWFIEFRGLPNDDGLQFLNHYWSISHFDSSLSFVGSKWEEIGSLFSFLGDKNHSTLNVLLSWWSISGSVIGLHCFVLITSVSCVSCPWFGTLRSPRSNQSWPRTDSVVCQFVIDHLLVNQLFPLLHSVLTLIHTLIPSSRRRLQNGT